MRKVAIILSILVLIASSCGQTTRQQVENNKKPTDSLFLSSNEMPKSEMHTDTFEYIDYNVDYDYAYFILKRNEKEEYLYDGFFEEVIPDLSNGDLIEVQWQLDSIWVADDNESFGGLNPFAKKIKKIGNAKDIQCDEYDEDYTKIIECTFEGKNMKQVYDFMIAKETNEYLKPELPLANIQYAATEVTEVEYKYKSEKHLLIEVFYAGGINSYEIIENKNCTILKTTYSAD